MDNTGPVPQTESQTENTPGSSPKQKPALKLIRCGCDGYGYREEDRNVNGLFQKIKVYCDCELGKHLKYENSARKREYDTQQAMAAAPQRIIAADVPRRYQDFNLSDSPLQGESAKIVEQMRSALNPESWFLFGRFGVGKTGLAVSYIRHFVSTPALYKQCYDGTHPDILATFSTTPDLLSQLRDTYNGHTSEFDIIKQFRSVPLLVLDDIGAEHVKDTEWLSARMYQILDRRNTDGLPTIFTSNVTFDDLAKTIGERVVERMLEMCGLANIVEITGPNLRVKK